MSFYIWILKGPQTIYMSCLYMDFIYLQHANPWQSRAEQATDFSSKAENQFKIEVAIWGKYHILSR